MRTFSLKWLLIAVAFVALSVVALLNANSVWQSAFENAALVFLLVAIVGMVASMGESRVFWFGCFLFGATYFVLATGFFGFERTWRLSPSYGFRHLHKQMFSPQSEVIP